ncbi:hypothetical protein EVAR_84316_1 [Eumeta japonica]|uniref:Uncharacterized protein n=1 Tax=Eumeta variegata TaxID=151549 RepID=A0A4C1U482_EUMVA|nr:hypothetical protein EVAR_84316_1 [Eumeta japonica]
MPEQIRLERGKGVTNAYIPKSNFLPPIARKGRRCDRKSRSSLCSIENGIEQKFRGATFSILKTYSSKKIPTPRRFLAEFVYPRGPACMKANPVDLDEPEVAIWSRLKRTYFSEARRPDGGAARLVYLPIVCSAAESGSQRKSRSIFRAFRLCHIRSERGRAAPHTLRYILRFAP